MSLIEEALRRVQEAAPAAAATPATTITEEVGAPAGGSAPEEPAPVRRPQGGTIPPLLPSPITLGGVGLAAMAVGVLVMVSALTLRHPPSKPTGRSQPPAVPAAPQPPPQHATVPAPAPAVAAPVQQPPAPAAAIPKAIPLSAGDPVTAVPGFEAPQFVLNGIVRGSGEPVAIINGRILKVGETLAGATLSDILSDAVRLRWPDREVIIRMTR